MNKKQIIARAKKIKWYRQAANNKAYYIFAPSRGAIDSLKAPAGFWSFSNQKYLEWFCPENSFNINAKKLLALHKKNGRAIYEIKFKAELEAKKIFNFFVALSPKRIEKMDLPQIQSAIIKLEALVHAYWRHIYVCDWFDPHGEQLLKKEIATSKIKFNTYEIACLLKPVQKHYAQFEREEMLKLALKCKSGSISKKWLDGKLKAHAKKYFYIDNSWESTRVLVAANFEKRLADILKLSRQEIHAQVKDIEVNWEQAHDEIYKKHNLGRGLKNVFAQFRTIGFMRDERKGLTLLVNHYYDVLFSRLAKLTKIPFADFKVCTPTDLRGALVVAELKAKIKNRKNIFVEVYAHGQSEFYFGSQAKAIYAEFHSQFNLRSTVLKGGSAYRGVVQGTVRVVMGETHFGKFNEGEILVAPMTRPEYLPIMKKAAAIITDEGGLTCHAAIISRELKIPCVVGIQTATKVLKDGDMVEVDANKGIVRKI